MILTNELLGSYCELVDLFYSEIFKCFKQFNNTLLVNLPISFNRTIDREKFPKLFDYYLNNVKYIKSKNYNDKIIFIRFYQMFKKIITLFKEDCIDIDFIRSFTKFCFENYNFLNERSTNLISFLFSFYYCNNIEQRLFFIGEAKKLFPKKLFEIITLISIFHTVYDPNKIRELAYQIYDKYCDGFNTDIKRFIREIAIETNKYNNEVLKTLYSETMFKIKAFSENFLQ